MKRWNDLKVGTRLIISFLVVAIISGASGLIASSMIRDVDSDYSDALVDYGFAQGDLAILSSDFQAQCSMALFLSQLEIPEARQALRGELDAMLAQVQSDFQKVKDGIRSDEAMAICDRLEQKMRDYDAAREEFLRISETSPKEAMAYYQQDGVAATQAVAEIIQEMLSAKASGGGEISERLSWKVMRYVDVMFILNVLGFVISVVIAILTKKRIMKPLQDIKASAVDIAGGNLNTRVTYESKDEFGVLSESIRAMIGSDNKYMGEISDDLERMARGDIAIETGEEFAGDYAAVQHSITDLVESLNATLSRIDMASNEVASGSDQVSAGAQALAQGSTQQASSVEELASTINEVSSQIRKNADDSAEASAKAQSVAQDMADSNAQMKELIDAMQGISENAEQISKITKAIEDIAFRTNILALNAAVEAARAGAAGKGFAVVADEVRNLAQKSAEASQNTTELIEQTLNAVQHGLQITDRTAAAFDTAVQGVREVSGTIDAISDASNEQARSMEQVASGVDQISSVVQTNSATAEQSAAVSKELSDESKVLKELVGRFKLKGR